MLKYLVRKNFIVFNFHGWSQPWKLNTDHILYVTLHTSTVVIATMDIHRTLESKRRDMLILLETVIQSHFLSHTSIKHQIISWLRGVVKSTQRLTSFVINYHLTCMMGIVDFRVWETKLKPLPSLGTRLHTAMPKWLHGCAWYLGIHVAYSWSIDDTTLSNVHFEALSVFAAILPTACSIDGFLQPAYRFAMGLANSLILSCTLAWSALAVSAIALRLD